MPSQKTLAVGGGAARIGKRKALGGSATDDRVLALTPSSTESSTHNQWVRIGLLHCVDRPMGWNVPWRRSGVRLPDGLWLRLALVPVGPDCRQPLHDLEHYRVFAFRTSS
jgi:hypothetical protein